MSNRCSYCNIKTGINYFNCKCDENKIFCNKCKYSFNHNCTIDVVQNYKDKLENIIIKVESNKIERI